MLFLCSCPSPQLCDIYLMTQHDHMVLPAIQYQKLRQLTIHYWYDNIITNDGRIGFDAGRKISTIAQCKREVYKFMRFYYLFISELQLL